MPTYVYACKNCGHGFEQRQSFQDAALTTCPQCHQEALHKVYNSVGIVFKGSGFYSTDSQAKKTPAAGTDSSATNSSETSTASGSGDGAGAKKADSATGTSSAAGTGTGSTGSGTKAPAQAPAASSSASSQG